MTRRDRLTGQYVSPHTSPILGSVKLDDTDASNTLELYWNEDDSSDRTFALKVGGGNRTLELNENLTVAGGYDITLLAEDATAQITLDNMNLEIEDTVGSGGTYKVVNGTGGNIQLTVEGTSSVIDQDVTQDNQPQFAGVILTADIDTDADAIDWDLLDDDSAALSFDVAGKAGMLVFDTTNGSEKLTSSCSVEIAGDLTVSGTTTTISTTILLVEDKLITLNDGGAAASGDGAGFEIEEDGSATAYIKTSSDRNKWEFKVPNNAAVLTLDLDATKTWTVNGDLNVQGDSAINQDVQTTAAPQFAGVTLTGDITTTGAAVDWDLVDDNASALSFDAAGKAGLLEFVTTNTAEGVNMSGFLSVTGALTADSVALKDSDDSNTLQLFWDEDDSSDRTLGFKVNSGNRTIDLAANIDIDGTLTVSNAFTVGTTNGGTLDFTAASKTLNVEDDSTVNQDLTTDANVQFNQATINSAVITGGTNTFDITNGTASFNVAAACAVDIDANVDVDAALTVSGAFTVGATNGGALDFSAASKTLTVEDDSIVNQDLTTDADVQFDDITLTGEINQQATKAAQADEISLIKQTYQAGDTYTGTQTALTIKAYDTDNTVVHDGNEFAGLAVFVKQHAAMTSGGKSSLATFHMHSGSTVGTDFGLRIFGDQNEAGIQLTGGTSATGLDLSNQTITSEDIKLSNGDTIFNSSAGVIEFGTDPTIYLGAGKIGRDADNLIKFSTDNQITFRTNGVDQIYIDSNGNLQGGNNSVGFREYMVLGNATTYYWSAVRPGNLTVGGQLNFQNADTGYSGTDGFALGINSSEQGLIWNYENTDILIATNNTQVATFTTAGALNIDAINEYTTDNGVAIEGVLLKDSILDTNVAAAKIQIAGTGITTTGTDANVPLIITLKGTGGSAYAQIKDTNGAGHLAVGDTSASERSILSIVDGGTDKPGVLQLYNDSGSGMYQWMDTNNVLRVKNADWTDPDSEGYQLIDFDNGTIGATGQDIYGQDIYLDTGHGVIVNSIQVVTDQQAHIGDPAATANDITDNTGGTPSGTHTIVDITGEDAVSQADVEANFATIAAEYNTLKDDVEANNSAIDSILSALETHGLLASS